jgi:hypothetical protein
VHSQGRPPQVLALPYSWEGSLAPPLAATHATLYYYPAQEFPLGPFESCQDIDWVDWGQGGERAETVVRANCSEQGLVKAGRNEDLAERSIKARESRPPVL